MGAGRGRLALRDKGRTDVVRVYFCLHRMNLMQASDVQQRRQAIPSFLLGHAAAGAGLVFIGYFSAVLVHFEWMLGAWSTPFVLMVVVSVMVMVLLTVRREEGTLSFGRAFGLSLLSGWIARIGYNLFNLLYFHWLRPNHVEAYVSLLAAKSEEALAVFGMDLSQEAMRDMDLDSLFRDQALWSLSPLGQATDAVTSIFWVGLVALIVAAILRRSPENSAGSGG